MKIIANLIFFLPGLKELHEGASLLYKARLYAADFGEGQDGFKGPFCLTGRPQPPTGRGESVIYQTILIFNHLLKDGCLPLYSAQNALKKYNTLQ